MNDTQKLLYRIALTQINGVGDLIARKLLEVVGDEEVIFRTNKKELLAIEGLPKKLADEILHPDVLRKAEQELAFVEKNKLKTFFYTDVDYPYRLKECSDSPILLYYKGNADLNAEKIISVVGTRKSTDYGNKFCEEFMQDISLNFPDVLIISGLAYGIDIQSHRAALKSGLSTVGVLAHGLDRIYPSVHRKTAVEMLEKGGLLTEFPSKTEPDKHNFVRRNRIVAGIADAVIVVESDVKGGSLITAEIANSYNRDTFALPGRTTDIYSKGCNRLINQNKAAMVLSAEDFIQQMNWGSVSKQKPKQKELFLQLNDEEQKIYDLLSKEEPVHVNVLSIESGIPVSQLFSVLLEMEMKAIIKPLPGSAYKLA